MQENKGFYWSLDLVPLAVTFLIVGYLLKGVQAYLAKPKVMYGLMAIGAATNLSLGFWNIGMHGLCSFYTAYLGNPLLYLLAALGGILAVMLLCMKIGACKVIEYIGRSSLVFYAFQNSFAIPLVSKLPKFIEARLGVQLPDAVSLVIVLVLACFLLAGMNELLQRYMPFATGKGRLRASSTESLSQHDHAGKPA